MFSCTVAAVFDMAVAYHLSQLINLRSDNAREWTGLLLFHSEKVLGLTLVDSGEKKVGRLQFGGCLILYQEDEYLFICESTL